MLKFAKASDGRETVHHLVLMLLLMYHIRNANLSKSLLLNLLGKSGGKKIFLLTGLRHLLCCCLNLKIWLQFQNFAPLQLLAQLEKSFSLWLQTDCNCLLLKNNFISREIQKGFLAGVPGCIEHTFALFEALRDSKQHYRQLVITWIDLANAYGSVRHNLIQFALEWYHVPKMIQMLIFNCYEQLCAAVFTNKY